MIYLIDTVGTESGMHLYDAMFYVNFKKAGKDVIVLSNFKENYTIQLISNYYHGNMVIRILKLIYSIIRLRLFQNIHNQDTFIYQVFGLNFIDRLYIRALCHRKNFYALVHDVFDIKDVDNSEKARRMKIRFYKKQIKHIICHSDKAEHALIGFGYEGQLVKFPHFRYNYDKQVHNYNEKNVGEDVLNSISYSRINLLFFGQLRVTKGVDVLMDTIKKLQYNDRVNIIVAGTDKDKLSYPITSDNARLILRYINDDEMVYLYTHCDYVLLPYKEVYQSGVMESMLYFKKPGIMSDTDYFKYILLRYPSFGLMYTPNNSESLSTMINDVSIGKYDGFFFYKEEDLNNYEKAHDLKDIILQTF